MDIYKKAAQLGLRFPSKKGELTTEQLFHLPLKAADGFDLDSTARRLSADLRAATQESFVDAPTTDSRLETSLEIVKDVIATKRAANAADLARRVKAEEKRKLLDALGAKKDAALQSASVEEIEKRLAELES